MAFFASATTNGPLVVSLAKNGIVSDATNGIDLGVAAPAGSTGQEVAINAILAAAFSSAGNAGVEIVWDVAVALGAPVYLYSNMTVRAPNPQCGAIMRAATNAPIFRLKGMDATVSSNISTQSQKNFGKIDSTAFGTTTGSTDYRYRVFDPTSINASNVAILGGTWNGNSAAQTVPGTQGTVAYGFVNVMQLWGVDGLTIKGARLYRSLGYNLHIINARRVVIEDHDAEQVWVSTFGNDTIHFNGPCTDLIINRARLHCGDDHIALNADDGASATNVTAGINWACSGAITNVRATNIQIWNGRENVTPWGAVRILSTAARVDDIIIRGVSGSTANWAFLLDTYGSTLVSGSGNVGRVIYDDISLDVIGSGAISNAVFLIGANAECVEIRNRYRYNAGSSYYDVRVEPSCTVKRLMVGGTWFQPASAANNPPIVRVGGAIGDFQFSGKLHRDSGLGATTMPVLQVLLDPAFNGRSAGTGSVSTAIIDVDATRVMNLVDLQAGTIGTLLLRGTHRNAGGGSPVATVTGATITNLIAGTGTTPLAWDIANTLVSGSGTIVRTNGYSESVAVATSYTMTDGGISTAAQGVAVPITLTPVGGTWPSNTVTLATTVAGTLTASSGCTVSGLVVTVSAGTTTPAIVNLTHSTTGSATISATNSGTMSNPTSLTYTVGSATPATAYTTSYSALSSAIGTPITITYTPTSGTWPTGQTITPTASTVTGTFANGTGGTFSGGILTVAAGATTPASVTFTPTGTPATGTLNSTSSPTMTNTTGAQTFTSTTAASPLLDTVSVTPKAAYSVRKLRSAYSGSALQVRRSSDSTTQDIGFTSGGDLDTTALTTFVGAGSGFVSKWYDQSGNGFDAVQATAAQQPRIVNAGTVEISGNSKPGIKGIASSTTTLAAPSVTLSGSTIATASVFSITNAARALSFIANGQTHDYDNASSAALINYDTSTGGIGIQFNNASAAQRLFTVGLPVPLTQWMAIWFSSTVTGVYNGTSGTGQSASPSLATGTLTLFGHAGPLACMDGFAGEHLVLTGTFSGTDQTTVKASQKAYFGTP